MDRDCWNATTRRGRRPRPRRLRQGLGTIAIGAPVAIPEMQALYELADQPDRGLPSPLAGRTAALAAFDLALLQSRLGNAAAAAQQLDLMLQLMRGTAPGAVGTGTLIQELSESATSVRDRFQAELQLDDSVIVSRFSKYQTQLRAWDERARAARLGEAAPGPSGPCE